MLLSLRYKPKYAKMCAYLQVISMLLATCWLKNAQMCSPKPYVENAIVFLNASTDSILYAFFWCKNDSSWDLLPWLYMTSSPNVMRCCSSVACFTSSSNERVFSTFAIRRLRSKVKSSVPKLIHNRWALAVVLMSGASNCRIMFVCIVFQNFW